MPSKREFHRIRRLRLVAGSSVAVTLVGVASVVSAIGGAVGHEPGWVWGVVLGLIAVAIGVAVGIWLLRHYDAIAAQEWQAVRDQGLDDGLPLGAFRRNELVGLEGNDNAAVLGLLLTGGGLLFDWTLIRMVDQGLAPWSLGLVMSVVVCIPGPLLLWLGTGTPYWLGPEGVTVRRRTRPSIRWDEVDEIIPMFKGSKTPDSPAIADNFLLRKRNTSRLHRALDGGGLAINVRRLEVDTMDLLRLLQERVDAARESGSTLGPRQPG